jgi:hypothetical protein
MRNSGLPHYDIWPNSKSLNSGQADSHRTDEAHAGNKFHSLTRQPEKWILLNGKGTAKG